MESHSQKLTYRFVLITEKRFGPAVVRPARRFALPHTIYAQVYPQAVRCTPSKNALSCGRLPKKPYM